MNQQTPQQHRANFRRQRTWRPIVEEVNRAAELGHTMSYDATVKRGVLLRATGKCRTCGGTLVFHRFPDGELDVGGPVLAMECVE